MQKTISFVSGAVNHIVITAFILMFLLVFTNVVLRFFFNSGLTFADEIARYAFVWCTFLGAVIALQKNAHIGVAGIRPYIAVRFHPWLDVAINIILLIIVSTVLIGSVEVLIANIGTRAPFTGAPIAIAQ